MQDPRLKPVEIPPPAEPKCMLGALLAGPAAWLFSPIVKLNFFAEPAIKNYNQIQKKSLLQTFDPTPPLDKMAEGSFALCGALLGLAFLWFAVERNEIWRPARKPAFAINVVIALLMIVHLFIHELPIFWKDISR
jgi:hypothetical protein